MPAYGAVSYGRGAYVPLAGNVPASQLNGGQFPLLIIEAGFGYGALTDPTVWTDITKWVRGYTLNRGRQHELNKFDAGTTTITLDNRDGRFSPFNTTSPYYPNILPLVPIRIRAVWNGLTWPRFRGNVESWQLKWPTVNDSDLVIGAVDTTKALNLKKAATLSQYAATVLADSPTHYYPLDDQPGSSIAVDSVGGAPGTVYMTAAAVGETAATFGGDPALVASNTTSLECGTTHGFVIVSAAAVTIEMWVKAHNSIPGTFYLSRTSVAVFSLGVVDGSTAGTTQGVVNFSYNDGGHIFGLTGLRPVNDAKWHHVVASIDVGATTLRLYIDGVLDASLGPTVGVTTTFPANGSFGGNPNTFGSGGTPTWNGVIDEVATYSTVLTATQVAAHYTAGAFPLTGQTSGQRLASLLTAVGIPTTRQAVDAGQSVVQPATNAALTSSVLANGQTLEETENGQLFISAAGNITFYDRMHTSRTPNSTVSIVLGDSGTAAEEPFRLDGTDPVLDDTDIWNDVAVTPAGLGPQTASDSTSQGLYGKRTRAVSTINASASDAAGRASADLNRYKTPTQRVKQVVFTPISDPAVLFPAALGFELLTRVELRRRPKDGSASTFDQTALIEGMSEAVDAGNGTWTTTWRLSPTDATPIFAIFSDPGPAGMFGAAFAY